MMSVLPRPLLDPDSMVQHSRFHTAYFWMQALLKYQIFRLAMGCAPPMGP
jgi:hypothetical protein